MAVNSQVQAGVVYISITGSFDILAYEAFNEIIKQNAQTATQFRLDFKEVTAMDSSALGMLLLLREKVGEDQARKIVLFNVSKPVMAVLEIAKFDQLFTVE